MKYIMNAYEWDPHFYQHESLFYGGYDTDTIYIPTSQKHSHWSYNEDKVDVSPITKDKELNPALKRAYHVFPIYLYDHSGQKLQLQRSCPWDTSLVTIALLPRAGYPTRALARAVLEKEIQHENNLLQNDHYYIIDGDDGNLVIDSCSYMEISNFAKQYNAVLVHEETRTVYVTENGKEVTL